MLETPEPGKVVHESVHTRTSLNSCPGAPTALNVVTSKLLIWWANSEIAMRFEQHRFASVLANKGAAAFVRRTSRRNWGRL